MRKYCIRSGMLVVALFYSILFLGHALGNGIGIPGDQTEKPTPSGVRSVENVFVIVIDGVRNSEAFKDPAHRYIPHIWNDLKPLGMTYLNFYSLGRTDTTPGHYTLATGSAQMLPNLKLNGIAFNIIQERPSFFQYYRQQLGIPQDATWILNGKGRMMGYMGESLNPFYGDAFAPSLAIETGAPDDIINQIFNQCIDTYHPSLTVINLQDVDKAGHTGDWHQYTQAILKADTIVYDMCQAIWRDPHYADNTVIIITSDHGRHLDQVASGFVSHGCCCMGCRDVPFLAIGPGIRKDAVVIEPGFLRDIAPTIAWMLGFNPGFAKGRILDEMFAVPPPVSAECWQAPSIACANGKVHVAASVRDATGTYHVIYNNSLNNGLSWSDEICLSKPPQLPPQYMIENTHPVIVAEGKRVSVVWSSIQVGGPMKTIVRESFDTGNTWEDPVFIGVSNPLWADIHPDACYRNGVLHVTWTDQRYNETDLFVAEIQGSSVIGYDVLTQEYAIFSRSAPSDTGIHVVCQKLSDVNMNWNISYCRHDGVEWSDPVYLTETFDHSLRPDIAVDESGIHVVWAERISDQFKIMITNSSNGSDWSNPLIVGENLIGSWRPRISAADNRLAVVWEGYESMRPTLFYSISKDGGATWTPPKQILQSGVVAAEPALLLESRNSLHVTSTTGSWPAELLYTYLRP